MISSLRFVYQLKIQLKGIRPPIWRRILVSNTSSLDESNFKVRDLLKEVGDTLLYEYDFGDGWSHQIKLEEITPYEMELPLPQCIKGKRACPPEDVGGVPGYMDFIEKWQDGGHPEHDDVLDWVGDYFVGPEDFDQAETNEMLRDYFDGVM